MTHPEVAKEDAYKAELEYFVRCIEEGRRPEITTPADARLSLGDRPRRGPLFGER